LITISRRVNENIVDTIWKNAIREVTLSQKRREDTIFLIKIPVLANDAMIPKGYFKRASFISIERRGGSTVICDPKAISNKMLVDIGHRVTKLISIEKDRSA
jgi:hypothetical protein